MNIPFSNIMKRSCFSGFLFVFAGIISLPSCASMHASHKDDKIVVFSDPEVDRSLIEAARQVTQSMNEWTAIQSYLHPVPHPITAPYAGPLAERVDVDWDGPVERLLHTLSDRLGFQFVTEGQPTYTPLQVTVHAHAETLFAILQNTGSQLGAQATLRVETSTHRLVLGYHRDAKERM